MFGWINDAVESLVVAKFGMEKWHEIKEKAGCEVTDGGFIRHKYYTDQSSIDLVVAISEVLNLSVNDVLEVFGAYFMEFTRDAGYDNLLSCQGSNLRLWLSNLNALHDHLQDTLPRGRFPEFWCKDDSEVKGTILLYYFSERGSLFVPFVYGLVKEVAKYHFDLEITMDLLQTQGENDCEYSCWRIGTLDVKDRHKLSDKTMVSSRGTIHRQSSDIEDALLDADIKGVAETAGCPFHQMKKIAKEQNVSEKDADKFWDRAGVNKSRVHFEEKKGNDEHESEGNNDLRQEEPQEDKHPEVSIGNHSEIMKVAESSGTQSYMSNANMMKVFPYHLVVDKEFTILQSGNSMAKLVGSSNIVGRKVSSCLEIKRPVLAKWSWDSIQRFDGQTYFFSSAFGRKKSLLKGHFMELSAEPKHVVIFLAPDAKNIQQLTSMNLTMSDLPTHTFQRDAIFLGEHMYSGIRSAHKLDKLSRKLAYEHNLSNSLLYSMLPTEVAKVLRAGQVFEPHHHDNVTLFFSDVVGFTDMCSELPPWDIIDMLNRLYTVMDYLAEYFGLYKVETIGDAYMCCSGLPEENENHAEDVANFALAARDCVSLVKNPLTSEPIRVRIGVHTGSCMSGVVGTMTPRYCLFGDMVNTTSRHESTGEADRIQCSSITFGKLNHFSPNPEHFNFTPRGLVDMKGKGKMYTYWLESAGTTNPILGSTKMIELRKNVQEMLEKKTWKKRQYFERRSSASTFQSLLVESEASDEQQNSQKEEDRVLSTEGEENNDGTKNESIENNDNVESKRYLPPFSDLELDPLKGVFSSDNSQGFNDLLADDLSEEIRRASMSHIENEQNTSPTLSESPSGSSSLERDLDSSYHHLRASHQASSHAGSKRGSMSLASVTISQLDPDDDVSKSSKKKTEIISTSSITKTQRSKSRQLPPTNTKVKNRVNSKATTSRKTINTSGHVSKTSTTSSLSRQTSQPLRTRTTTHSMNSSTTPSDGLGKNRTGRGIGSKPRQKSLSRASTLSSRQSNSRIITSKTRSKKAIAQDIAKGEDKTQQITKKKTSKQDRFFERMYSTKTKSQAQRIAVNRNLKV